MAVDSGTGAAAWSADGVTWNQSALPSSENWRDIVFGNGRFVAVATGANIAAYLPEFITSRAAAWSAYWKEWNPSPIGSRIISTADYAPRDCLLPDGSLLARASYPDLWNFASKSGNIVTEADWGYENYSHGNGSTTFRLPKIEQHGRIRQFIKAVK